MKSNKVLGQFALVFGVLLLIGLALCMLIWTPREIEDRTNEPVIADASEKATPEPKISKKQASVAPSASVVPSADRSQDAFDSPYGMNIHSGDDYWKKSDARYYSGMAGLFSEAGVRWVRLFVTWNTFEPEDGKWDTSMLTKLQGMLADLESNGLSVSVVLTNPPEWAADRGSTVQSVDVDAWEGFVEKIALFAPKTQIDAWEIENEISDKELYTSNRPNYIQMLVRSREIIKKADPNDLVVMSAIVPLKQNGEITVYWMKWAKNYVDVLNIHHYTASDEKLTGKIELYKSFLTQAGITDKPIWLTETNICTSTLGDQCRDPQDGGVRLRSRYETALAAGMAKVFWFKETTQMWGPGLLENPYKDNLSSYQPHEPIYSAYKDMALE